MDLDNMVDDILEFAAKFRVPDTFDAQLDCLKKVIKMFTFDEDFSYESHSDCDSCETDQNVCKQKILRKRMREFYNPPNRGPPPKKGRMSALLYRPEGESSDDESDSSD